ncbi:TIGR04282 family arsenosugar biosynthesis glycosyltransferase [Chloroflexota bacterium]
MKNNDSNNPDNTSLIIFIRLPSPGRVKSRLATSLGAEIATKVYQLCAEHVFQESDRVSSGIQKYVFYSDRRDEEKIKQWAGSRFRFSPQVQGNLGKRIDDAFRTVFDRGTRKAIIVASDVPDLSAEIIDDAASKLDEYDIVIGPCRDGGYYLLGMNKFYRQLFQGIAWSTGQVYRQTLYNAKEMDLKAYSLPCLTDIDTEEDLRQWSEITTDGYHPLQQYAGTLGFQIDI